jgi:dCTP deaminase
MILTKDRILKLIAKKKVIIEPFDPANVGPASIDLTLGDRLWIPVKQKTVTLSESSDFRASCEEIDLTKGYVLKPKQFVLGITKEKLTLPDDVAGWLNSRSMFARFGLQSHSTAPFICPGISNHQILEIYNLGDSPLRLMPGTKICQMILEQCKGRARYDGQFKEQ